MNTMMNRIRIVLVRTTDSRNIGGVARAMNTTGFSRLVLVNPVDYDPQMATRVASGSGEVVDNAVIAGSVTEAVADCDFVVGATRRKREIGSGRELPPLALAEEIGRSSGSGEIAIIFGPERTGLTNSDLEPCHRILTIPLARPDLSLNLAQAVMVVCYELYHHFQGSSARDPDTATAADSAQLEDMYRHLEQAVTALEFPPQRVGKWQSRVRGLLQRARLKREETHLIRSLAHQIIKRCGKPPRGD